MERVLPHLTLNGVRQNNLKDIDIELPLGRAIIITGPSGSGKSSLAFDTIYAEGQRRYMQSLSTYARQFMEKFKAPLVEKIMNIPPTVALQQLNPVRNSRATVGTTTEIYDYLRLLFEKIGTEYCETCQIPMERLTFGEIFNRIKNRFADETILICFKKEIPKHDAGEFLAELLRAGYSRMVMGGVLHFVEPFTQEKGKSEASGKTAYIILDRLRLGKGASIDSQQTRISEALRAAMELGLGEADVLVEQDKKFSAEQNFTIQSRCPKCRKTSTPKGAISFSFNSPLGACQTCKGFGNTLEIDEDLVIPNPQLSLIQGAIDPFTKPSLRQWQKKLLAFCKATRIDTELPYRELSDEHKRMVFDGEKKFRGVRGVFRMLEKEKYKMRIRVFLSRYTSPFLCPECKGARLNPSALRVKISEKSIADLCNLSLDNCHHFLKTLALSPTQKEVAKDILAQIDRRLGTLRTVGLGYLTTARLSRSLSGGEYQRILLATQLCQGLTDTLYVLDEPSIGLHPKDTKQLLEVLQRLLELGNSLVLVEHDPEIITWGQYIVDMGPGSGSRGGTVMFSGSQDLFSLSDCQTSLALRSWKDECRKALQREAPAPTHWLEVHGASGNNLRNIDVHIPLQQLVSVTGVSGSGKSTLIVDTVYQALSKIFNGRSEKISKFESISGFDHLSGVELVDQSPIGKSSRSNPITFIRGYDEVRSLFANTHDAVAKNLAPGHFSFNVSGGRCETCEGEGRIRVDMVFMEDIWVPCQVCDEKRFKASILNIRYKGKNIDDILRMTVDEAFDFFKSVPSLKTKFSLLQEVGLGYIQLGQPGYTLSGGEAQRLKIARELAGGSLRKGPTLFILDEPTTGLHFGEITKLISVLRTLLAAGHSVVVIEHNLQLICASDFVIDLGPDGGEQGGSVVALGTPKKLAQTKLPHTGLYLSEIIN